ncbi:hypothetical protein ASD02_16435 [Ensifer sp. Root1252]|nr:hypothetical protein ASD02_16435 [Ensifer sp. Root1252]KQW55688.1 hypothetical protein ASD03_19250 [Ensifer sp. Root127]KRC57145.1 hypothetical protein ASE32_19750 [Ensifer sp. Root231]KRC87640.1 hypothetical protein ASE47_13905 [Ensifer sp. Root258]
MQPESDAPELVQMADDQSLIAKGDAKKVNLTRLRILNVFSLVRRSVNLNAQTELQLYPYEKRPFAFCEILQSACRVLLAASRQVCRMSSFCKLRVVPQTKHWNTSLVSMPEIVSLSRMPHLGH